MEPGEGNAGAEVTAAGETLMVTGMLGEGVTPLARGGKVAGGTVWVVADGRDVEPGQDNQHWGRRCGSDRRALRWEGRCSRDGQEPNTNRVSASCLLLVMILFSPTELLLPHGTRSLTQASWDAR